MHPLYVISGISGSGKSTLAKIISRDLNITHVEQDDYYLSTFPKFTLSNGEVVNNWDSPQALDPNFSQVLSNMLLKQPVLVNGFALNRSMLPILPTVHIHLVTASNPKDLKDRCIMSRRNAKPNINIKRDILIVKELVIPFYHENVRNSDITHLLKVFKNNTRIPLPDLVTNIKDIIAESFNYRCNHHIMHVEEPYFSLIKNGVKPVEGRKITGKWLRIQPGDKITITHENNNSYEVRVKKINLYLPSIGDPLSEYLKEETLARTLPNITDFNTAKEVYLQWSTEKEIKDLGMLGIQVEVI